MKKAQIAWIVALGGLVVFDIVMALNSTPGDTLSEYVWSLGITPQGFFLGLGVGVVLGHLFWQKGKSEDS